MNQLATDLLNQTRSDDEMSIQTAALLRQAADAIEEAEKVNAKLFADYVSAREQLVCVTDEKRLARILAKLDGWNPDAIGDFSVKVIREGRRTDTGHDTRTGTTETVTSEPAWTAYTFKARKLIAAITDDQST